MQTCKQGFSLVCEFTHQVKNVKHVSHCVPRGFTSKGYPVTAKDFFFSYMINNSHWFPIALHCCFALHSFPTEISPLRHAVKDLMRYSCMTTIPCILINVLYSNVENAGTGRLQMCLV